MKVYAISPGETSFVLTLNELLQHTPVRLLAIIGRRRGLSFAGNTHKAILVERLTARLADPTDLKQVWVTLSETERQLITDFVLAGGYIPVRFLEERYGSLRAVREIILVHRPNAQNQAPTLTPVERLLSLGLVFHWRRPAQIVCPSQILDPLRQLVDWPAAPDVSKKSPNASKSEPIDLVISDLTSLLALVQRDAVRPIQARWLPARFLRTWGDGCVRLPVHAHARSEWQTGRRRFLHYLAEQAGLLAASDQAFSLSPAAWQWFITLPSDQRAALWQLWLQPDPDRWRTFRLPGYRWLPDPTSLLRAIAQELTEFEPTSPTHFRLILFARQPDLLDLVPANIFDRQTQLAETIEQLLAGPLVWLGILEPAQAGWLRLTAWGAACLGLADPPPLPTIASFHLAADHQPDPFDTRFRLLWPADHRPSPKILATAIMFTDQKAAAMPGPSSSVLSAERDTRRRLPLVLSPTSFSRALQQGWSAPAFLQALQAILDHPLARPERNILKVWAEAAGRMTIRTVPILETTDPAILSRLAATKRGRRLMGRSLSTRTVIVDGRRLDQLIRRLTEQEGMPPQIAQQNEPADPIVASTGKPVKQLPTNHAAHLWQAARVYQMLGRYINLPSRFPADLFEALTNQVDPIAKAAAEAAVDQVVEALEAALTGRVAYPPWPEEGLPIEQSLSVIEQALAESALIEIDYYALSTETITRRTVEPYRVEWWHKKNKRIQPSAGATHSPAGIDIESHAQGISLAGSDQVAASPEHRVSRETPYLVGFCHRAQAERLFRLDRIRRIALLAGADD